LDIEARRKYQREYNRKLMQDPEKREKLRIYSQDYARRRRETDPSVRKKNAAYVRMKRATDSEYHERTKFYNRRYHDEVVPLYKESCINMYTNGEATCRWCGQGDMDVLCLDHVNDDGKQHAKVSGHRCGQYLFRWLMKNDYPPGFQVLCASCNMKKEAMRRRRVLAERRSTQRVWTPMRRAVGY
jgi:hypothetical protein